MRIRVSHAKTRTTLVVLSTAIALLAAEALARIIGVGPTFGQLIFVREIPTRIIGGVPLWKEKYPSRYDSEDMKQASTDRDAFTILGLGDSIMYGVWQAKENTYLEQTRRVLARRSKRPVAILNAAVPGYNTVQEDVTYGEIEDQIKPDLVLVHYWLDDSHHYRVVDGYAVDFGNMSDDASRLADRALPLPPRMGDFLLVHSRVYDLLMQVVFAANQPAEPFDWTPVSTPLASIQERAQRAGGRLLVLASAQLDEPSPKPNGDLVSLQQFALSRGIEVIDLSEWLTGVDSTAIAIDGCHFNAEGHRLIGEHLADYLLQHDLKE